MIKTLLLSSQGCLFSPKIIPPPTLKTFLPPKFIYKLAWSQIFFFRVFFAELGEINDFMEKLMSFWINSIKKNEKVTFWCPIYHPPPPKSSFPLKKFWKIYTPVSYLNTLHTLETFSKLSIKFCRNRKEWIIFTC